MDCANYINGSVNLRHCKKVKGSNSIKTSSVTIKELKQKLRKLKIDPISYCLEGGQPNETYTLNRNVDTWEVYYSERGNKNELKIFEFESDACEFFLSWISELNGRGGMSSMKTKSLYIQVDIIVVITMVAINILTFQYNRKYEVLGITAESNSSVPFVLLFLDILSLMTLGVSWWLIIYRSRKGVKTISILTIIILILIVYWWVKA